MKVKISYQKFKEDVKMLANKILERKKKYNSLYAIPRGGVCVALELTKHLNLPLVEVPDKDSLIIDDLVDSGKTIFLYKKNDKAILYLKPNQQFGPIKNLIYVEKTDGWIEFFYEKTKDDLKNCALRLLQFVEGGK